MSKAPPIPDFNRMADGEEREAARLQAYESLFGSRLGRLVLVDIMLSAGVGRQSGPQATADLRAYNDGRQDVALDIKEAAGFGPADAATVALTEMEMSDERHDDFRDGIGDDAGDAVL